VNTGSGVTPASTNDGIAMPFSLSGGQWIEVVMTTMYTRPSWAVRRVSAMLGRLLSLVGVKVWIAM
jgi:hypothetical protein